MMLHRFKEPQINKANYTTLLKDIDSEKLQAIQTLMNGFTTNSGLYDMFMSVYRFYEINDKDEDIFVQCVTDTYNEYHDYYKELFDNYTKAYDFATQNKRTTTRTDTSQSAKQEIVSNTNNGKTEHFDLPNKTVSSPDGYLDEVTKDSGTNTTTGSTNGSNNYGSEVITQYDNEFLDLKRQYLNQIRNVYHEFCDKFKDCFIQIYS